MKSIKLLVLAVVAASLAACTGQQYTASAEYDDVYYTKADQAAPVAYEDNVDDRAYSERRTVTREPVDSYRDHYYEDDDFTFSRRLRRFSTTSSASNWRYYDPFYSNDLYFVMGTPAWNTWNNNGWYNWNRPRFGAVYNPWNDPFNNNFNAWNRYNQWNSWNTWNSPYSNPWVSNYYGYGAGSGIGFGNPYSPFGNAYYAGSAAYYCPPVGFVPGNSGWGFNSRNNSTAAATVSRPRTPRTSPAARTPSTARNSTINNTRPTTTPVRTRVSNPNAPRTASTDYTRPRPASARPARVGGTSVSPNRTGRTTRPTTTTTRPAQPRVYTRPGRTSSPSRVGTPSSTRPSRMSTRPSRTTTRPSRTTTTRPSTVSPRRSSGSSFSRPSTTPSRSGSSIRSGGSRSSTPRSSGSRSGGTVRRR